MRTVNRYLPYLRRPEPLVVTDSWHAGAAGFLTIGSSAFRRGGGKNGIPELWGIYNLSDVIASLEAVTTAAGEPFTNPLLQAPGAEGLVDKPIIFSVNGTVNSSGGMFEGSIPLFTPHIRLGFSLPIVRVEGRARYALVTRARREEEYIEPAVRNLEPGAVNQVERVRLAVHEEIGLRPDDWDVSGLGDLDLFIRFHTVVDHALLMRSANLNLFLGALVPTSKTRSHDFPSSVPFMGDGHWGIYAGFVPEFELKYDWRMGIQAYIAYLFEDTTTRRIPVYREPAIYSALVGAAEVQPGVSFQIAPYMMIENLIDNLHFQGRYTYTYHGSDVTKDKRGDCPVKSYLQLEPTDEISEKDICTNINRKEHLSAYRSHYLSLELRYDMRPAACYVMVDTCLEGSGVAKSHQLSLGVDLRF